MHPSHPRVLIFFLTIPDAVFYRTNFFPSAQRQAAGNCVTSPLPTSGTVSLCLFVFVQPYRVKFF